MVWVGWVMSHEGSPPDSAHHSWLQRESNNFDGNVTCVLSWSCYHVYKYKSFQFQLSQLPTQYLPALGNAGAGTDLGGTKLGEGGTALVLELELELSPFSPRWELWGAESELDESEEVDFGAIAIAVTPNGRMGVINTKQYYWHEQWTIFCFSLLVELYYVTVHCTVYLSSLVEIASLWIYHLKSHASRPVCVSRPNKNQK